MGEKTACHSPTEVTGGQSRAPRPMNVIEKILCHNAVGLSRPEVKVGDVICVKADWTIASELTWKTMDKLYSEIGRPKIHRPDRFWLAIDHTVDPRNYSDPTPRSLIKLATEFAEEAGLTDFWGPNQTILHTEFTRQRAQPGQVVIGADSHTCSAGGMGAMAVGLGAGDVVMPLVTGETWFRVPQVVYIEFVGKPPFGVGGKDIILHILGLLKRNTLAMERAVLYGGEGLKYLSDDARFAIANMTTEFGGIAGVFLADEITAKVLSKRKDNNNEGRYFRSDPGCDYADHRTVRLEEVVPQIALFPSPDNCVPVAEKLGMKLDGCFIGACTTTQEDLILAALVLQQAMAEGKTPSSEGRRRVTPGSLVIIQRLKELGLIDIYERAGFTVGAPGCSYCVGVAADVAGEGEVWLSSQNRNFRNRMGRGSIANLASAACVAASSFDMEVADPMPYLAKIDPDVFNKYREWEEKEEISVSFEISEPFPVLADGGHEDKEVNDATSLQKRDAEGIEKSNSSQNTTSAVISGRVQRFGDNIDTDAIYPAQFMGMTPDDPQWPEGVSEIDFMGMHSFAYVRPDFYEKVQRGHDIIVAGNAFGSGSSREEAARCLKAAGVKAVIARSFAYIYARNQPNNALLGIVITDPKFYELAVDEAKVEIDLSSRQVSVEGEENKSFPFSLTDMEVNFLQGGGLKDLYKKYDKHLFRAAMRNKAQQSSDGTQSCGSGCASNTQRAQLSW